MDMITFLVHRKDYFVISITYLFFSFNFKDCNTNNMKKILDVNKAVLEVKHCVIWSLI